LQGLTAAEIVRFAQEGGYDLIVMGTHGRKVVARVLLGSVAARVVQTAECPVLTVKRPAQRSETTLRVPASATPAS
jgi:nucleotide-binding universal stress UspA family protein